MKRILILAAAAALLASLTACGNTANAADADCIYGQIDSVSGNDIVLLLAEYNENAAEDSEDSAADSAERGGDSKRERPEGFDPSNFSGEIPEGFDPSDMPEGFSRSRKSGSDDESGSSKSERNRPEGFSIPEGFDPSNMPENFDPSNFSGEKPEGFSRSKKSDSDDESGDGKSERNKPEGFSMPEDFDPSNMPEGFSKPENGEMPESFDPPQFSKRQSGNSQYTLTGEQEELRVPVGTTVTTALGVETDFEVLKSGDMVKCSIAKDSDGKDVITGIWILEQ